MNIKNKLKQILPVFIIKIIFTVIDKKQILLFNIDIKRRSRLKISDYRKLSVDIPVLKTKELHSPNDFYGIATNLKKYSGFSMGYRIKAAIEHGIYYSDFYWNADIKAKVPALFCSGEKRKEVLKDITNKQIFKIGPTIAYAEHYLNNETLEMEKKRLGKNLLVFPLHSTHWVDVDYNIKNYCDFIYVLAKDFHQVRICLYWKDVNRGHDKIYNSYGFECVTAGHIYDPFFLHRLKSIIETSTVTMSNGLGTHLGFCIYSGKPHYLIREDRTYSDKDNIDGVYARIDKYNKAKDSNDLYKLFGNMRDDISQKQSDLVDLYWGISEVKSKDELRTIINISEDLYNNKL